MFIGFWFHLSIHPAPWTSAAVPLLDPWSFAPKWPRNIGTYVGSYHRVICTLYICIHTCILFAHKYTKELAYVYICIFNMLYLCVGVCVCVCVCHAIRIDKWKINGSRVTPNRGYYCSSSALWFYMHHQFVWQLICPTVCVGVILPPLTLTATPTFRG